jgi:hypothetical protein
LNHARTFAVFTFGALTLAMPARAQAAAPVIALAVEGRDPLPGFRKDDEAIYLSAQMRRTAVPGWSFAPAAPASLPPANRIEWRFELDPFAGGTVRQFFPMPSVARLFGARHLITAEAMLYLDNEYQTLMFGQATIQGGADDKALASFIVRMTENLLGEAGAYRAIDMNPPAAKP